MELRIDHIIYIVKGSGKNHRDLQRLKMLRQLCTGIVLTELTWKVTDVSAQAHCSQRAPWTRQHFMQKRNARLFPPGRHTQGIFQVPRQRVGSNIPMAEMPCVPPGVCPLHWSPCVLHSVLCSDGETNFRDSLVFSHWVILEVHSLVGADFWLDWRINETASEKNSKHPFN